MNPEKVLDQLRITRSLSRLSLTDCALVSGLPRWRVQQIFSGSHTPPKPAETAGEKLAWLEAMMLLAKPFVLILFIVTFFDSTVHQLFFFWTDGVVMHVPVSSEKVRFSGGTPVQLFGTRYYGSEPGALVGRFKMCRQTDRVCS